MEYFWDKLLFFDVSNLFIKIMLITVKGYNTSARIRLSSMFVINLTTHYCKFTSRVI